MKRRKWWFGSFGLVLLIACGFAWSIREQPPFRFLESAHFWVVHVNSSPGSDAWLYYYSSEEPSMVVERASREVAFVKTASRDKWRLSALGDQPETYVTRLFQEKGRAGIYDGEGGFPRVPSSVRSMIVVRRTPTFSDRVRAWIYRVRYP